MWVRSGVILVASLMLLSTASADGALSRPSAATALVIGDTAIVTWTPAVETPDAYKVWGVQGEGMLYLGSAGADDAAAQVAGGFFTYAVTAVFDGVDSDPTPAQSANSEGCVIIDWDPPGARIGECEGGGGGGGGSGGSRDHRLLPALY